MNHLKKTTISVIPWAVLGVVLSYAAMHQHAAVDRETKQASWMSDQDALHNTMADIVNELVQDRFTGAEGRALESRVEAIEEHLQIETDD